ncbi:unnamed protein product [Brassica oleracea var. botrytis]
MKVPRTNQLGVKTKDGLYYKFSGFRDQDVASLTSFFQSAFGKTPEEKQLSVSGRNWGEVDLNGNNLTFLVGGKQAFADVSQTQLQGKNDVLLEFHVDDTAGANEKDSLTEISFHIPNSNTQFVGDETRPPAQVLHDRIMAVAVWLMLVLELKRRSSHLMVSQSSHPGVGTVWSFTFPSYDCKDKLMTSKSNTVVLSACFCFQSRTSHIRLLLSL